MRDGLARTGLVIAIVVALAATVAGVWQGITASQLRSEVAGLSSEVTTLRSDVTDLQTELTAVEEQGGAGGDLEGLLDGLLGGGGGGGGGDAGGADGDGDGAGGAGGGELGDLLEGLLGGDLGKVGGLAEALGGGGPDLPGLDSFDPTACPPPTSLEVDRVDATTLEEQVEEVTAAVATIRDLPAADVDYEVLDGGEVAAEVDRILADEYPPEDADADQRTLTLLGAIAPGTDLVEVQRSLLTGQIAGFYDTDTKELVVRDEDGALEGEGLSALAHELTHALGDASLGLDIDDIESADAAAARSALVEGDASLAQLHFGLLATDPLSLLQGADPEAQAEAQAALDGAPPFVADQLAYPYTYGLGFVCGEYAEGGWDAVDALYDGGPVTTAEILFPERLGAPVAEPAAPAAPGQGWSEVRSDALGAFDLLALAAAPGGDRDAALDEPLERAAAWDGGSYVLWSRGDESAMGAAFADTGDGIELCSTLEEYYTAAFPDAEVTADNGAAMVARGADQSAVLRCEGDEVRLGIAPDVETAQRVATAG